MKSLSVLRSPSAHTHLGGMDKNIYIKESKICRLEAHTRTVRSNTSRHILKFSGHT